MKNYKQKILNENFTKSLCIINIKFAEKMIEEMEQIFSCLIVLADYTKTQQHIHQSEKFSKLLKHFGSDKNENFPVPLFAMLPRDIYLWNNFITSYLEEVNGNIFAVITEAYVARRELARDVDGRIHDLSLEDREEYSMVQIGIKGKNIRTFAAPLTDCLVNKQGDYKRKTGEWHEYKNIEKLAVPNEWK